MFNNNSITYLKIMTDDLKLAIGCCFYQDAKGLERLVESVMPIPFLSAIYAVDGKFKGPDFGNEQDPELSTDLNEIVNYVKIINKPNVSEWQKRQAYIEECYKDRPDFLFILDTDEYISYVLHEFEAHLREIKQQMIDNPKYIYHNVYDLKFDDRTQGIKNLKPRLWFRPYQMEYTDYMAYRNKQYPNYHTDPSGSMYPIDIMRGVSMIHDKKLRNQEYELKNREYHKRQLVPIPL
jgi:hypothetical protein